MDVTITQPDGKTVTIPFADVVAQTKGMIKNDTNMKQIAAQQAAAGYSKQQIQRIFDNTLPPVQPKQ